MQQKSTCFRRCLFLVEMRGIDSRRELRALVGRGHDSPPDCRSVPRLLRSPSSLFAKNKQKKEALAFLQVLLSGGDEGDRLAPRTARLGRSRSRQSTGLSLCTAPSSIPLAPFCKQQTKKEALAFLQVLLSGGDEGDRTPYLLNAIQALSQVSYTPMTYSLFAGVRFCAARSPK